MGYPLTGFLNKFRDIPPLEEDDTEWMEEEQEKEESAYEHYRIAPTVPDDDEYQERIERDEMLVRNARGYKVITQKEYYSLVLKVDRLDKRVVDLERYRNVSADSKRYTDTMAMQEKYHKMLEDSVEHQATLKVYDRLMAEKDETIEDLRAQMEEQKEAYKSHIETLKSVIESMSMGRAVQEQYTKPKESAPAEPKQGGTKFVSATGRTGKENKECCYWLRKAGWSDDEIAKVVGVKSVDAYAKQGEKILSEVMVSFTVDGTTHNRPATSLDPYGDSKEFPSAFSEGYIFPSLIVEKLWES